MTLQQYAFKRMSGGKIFKIRAPAYYPAFI
jgi:hypothetical protein